MEVNNEDINDNINIESNEIKENIENIQEQPEKEIFEQNQNNENIISEQIEPKEEPIEQKEK